MLNVSITVDEQLFAANVKYSVKKKFGGKFLLAVDSSSKFSLYGFT